MKHDLPYLRWNDFKDIRRQLAKSFQESARRSYASQVSAELHEEADEETLELTKADEIDASEDTKVWLSRMLRMLLELSQLQQQPRSGTFRQMRLKQCQKRTLRRFQKFLLKACRMCLKQWLASFPLLTIVAHAPQTGCMKAEQDRSC